MDSIGIRLVVLSKIFVWVFYLYPWGGNDSHRPNRVGKNHPLTTTRLEAGYQQPDGPTIQVIHWKESQFLVG